MDHRGQKPTCVAQVGNTAIDQENQTKGLLEQFETLWEETRESFGQKRTWEKAKAFALSSLVSMGRRTVRGIITTEGRQFQDWTADYRLFSRGRLDSERLFEVPRRGVLEQLSNNVPYVVAMDDSIFRKRGRKIHGVAYRRDPMSPPFHINFVRGQRFLQISAAMPQYDGPSPARMVPIDFAHCPTPQKPRKNASEENWREYRRAKKEANINLKGVERLCALRSNLDGNLASRKRLLVGAVDGRFTNSTVLKNMPERTVLIGRIRKDAKLYSLPRPETPGTRGRKPSYGERLPTPEELRKDNSIPWQKVTAFAAGKHHSFKIKTIAPVRWRTAGENRDLRLVIIAPLAYKLSMRSETLYRQPAYLICTDLDMPLDKIIQYYIWRWDIEVNFRDEKHILDVRGAQVRHPESVEKVPALIIASYAMLLLAARKAFGAGEHIADALPVPKWRRNKRRRRASTQKLINHAKGVAELWGKSMGIDNFSGFINQSSEDKKPEKLRPHLQSVVLYTYN